MAHVFAQDIVFLALLRKSLSEARTGALTGCLTMPSIESSQPRL